MHATVLDVKRVLGLLASDTSRDAEIVAALQVADEQAVGFLRRRYAPAGAQVKTFYRVRAGQTLAVGPDDAVITSVVHEGTALEFTHIGRGRVKLSSEWSTFEEYDVVTVSWTSTGVVPASVRDGTAMIAAALLPPKPVSAEAMESSQREIKSQRWDDYQVTFVTMDELEEAMNEVDGPLADALRLLRPFRRRKIVAVP